MKTIYMEQTLNLMASQNLEGVKELVLTGIVKQGEFGNYLVIETMKEEQI
jgi:hypothetical protein